MIISITFPSFKALEQFWVNQQLTHYNYKEQFGTAQEKNIIGYNNDQYEIYLGEGEEVWKTAKQILDNWQQFPSSWTKIYSPQKGFATNDTVLVLFRLFGIWWKNAARVVYTIDEVNRYGFAYGTLQQHVEKGEERFLIWRNEKGQVYYQIKAFSRPNYWYVKLGKPIARFFQKRFGASSTQLVKQLVYERLKA